MLSPQRLRVHGELRNTQADNYKELPKDSGLKTAPLEKKKPQRDGLTNELESYRLGGAARGSLNQNSRSG